MAKHKDQVIEDKRTIKRISNKRIRNGKVQYFVKWKGPSQQPGNWLPAQHLAKCHKKIVDFQQNIWKYKKKEQIRKRKALIKTLQEKQEYDKQLKSIQPLKMKLNEIEILQSQSISEQRSQHILDEVEIAKNQENLTPSKEKIKVARFDCVSGQWKNAFYTNDELTEINQLRNCYASEYQAKDVMIKDIVKVNGNLVVQYQMQNKKYQCLLKSFKLFLPQLLITYLLQFYNPAHHVLLRPETQQISQSPSSQKDDEQESN